MEHQVNRARQLYSNWEEREKQLQELAPIQDHSRMMTLEKYDFLRYGLYRLSASEPRDQERTFLKVIRSITDKLQKELYPNPLVRMLQSLKAEVYDKPVHLNQFASNKAQNLLQLKTDLGEAGFTSFPVQLENYLDYESNKVHVLLNSQLENQSKLDLKLNLEKDQLGQYRFVEYRATLISAFEEPVSYAFQAAMKITIEEAANLLQGRSVKKDHQTVDGTMEKKWLRLDFEQLNVTGDPKMIDFKAPVGYDAKNEALITALMPDLPESMKQQVLKDLESGHLLGFESPGLDKLYIHLRPLEGGVCIIDKNKNPSTLSNLMDKIMGVGIKNGQKPIRIKPRGRDKGNQEDQSMNI